MIKFPDKNKVTKPAIILLAVITLLMVALYPSEPLLRSNGGSISFFSEAPLENIDAVNNNIVSVINTTTNEIAIDVAIKSFHFKKAKMETDFNENFMESDKYPVAKYRGKIDQDIDWKKDGSYAVISKGILTIHGVAKERTDTASLRIVNGVASLESKFKVRVADHKVKIPTLLYQHIAEVVDVKLFVVYRKNAERLNVSLDRPVNSGN